MSIGLARQRGDTLVEVLIAMAVLAIVTVGSFSLMNKGVAMMYESMERSEARLLIDRQIESLTFARDQYLLGQIPGANLSGASLVAATAWQAIKSASPVTASPAAGNCSDTSNAFSLQRDASNNLKLVSGVTNAIAAGFPSPGDGIWIQKINSPVSAKIPYIDFYVRACWPQSTSSVTQVESSVVRLYDK